jgi:TetR/AcrR family transcriptional regulator, mexJK operon transcriptional repressor
MPDPQLATIERFQRKRQEILTAAREVFTREGYMGTSMDAVAGEAGASKRTVYQYFVDKEQLFAATVLDTVERGYEYFKPRILALAETDDAHSAIRDLARATAVGLMEPELLKMRRLVIAEAERFPQIGREYYERSWVRTLKLLSQALNTLTDRGLLAVADPDRAASIFTWLIVSIPANRVAFLGDAAVGAQQELIAHAEEGARVFLAAYGPHVNDGPNPSRRKDVAGAAAPARDPQLRRSDGAGRSRGP